MDDSSGTVIGIAQVRRRPSHSADLPPEAANHVFYEIAPAHRGRGHGKVLLRLALMEAQRIGLERVCLTCNSDNHASCCVIEATGGVRVAAFSGEQVVVHLYEIALPPRGARQ